MNFQQHPFWRNPWAITIIGGIVSAVIAGLLLSTKGSTSQPEQAGPRPSTTAPGQIQTPADARSPTNSPTHPGALVSVYLTQQSALTGPPDTGSRTIGGGSFPNSVYTDIGGCNGLPTSVSYDYDLGRHYRRFVVYLGVDDDSFDASTTIQFETYVDGVRMSRTVKTIGNPSKISLSVIGGLRLRIMATLVHPVQDDNCNDFAVWGDAQLPGVPGEVPPPSPSP